MSTLRVLTYNIWFHYDRARPAQYVTRMRSLLRLLRDVSADCICLQEAIPLFFTTFRDDDDYAWLLSTYDCSDKDLDGKSVYPYGTVIFTRSILGSVHRTVPLTSRMDRKLVSSTFTIDDIAYCISTVHLESLANQQTRVTQMKEIREFHAAQSGTQRIVLCGDFNFCSYRNFYGARPEHQPLDNADLARELPYLVDVYPHLNPGCSPAVDEEGCGYTFDTTRNGMLRAAGHAHERMRYDRILYSDYAMYTRAPPPALYSTPPRIPPQPSFESSPFVPTGVELVGTDTIPSEQADGGGKLCISDHFGVLAAFELAAAGTA